MELEFCLILHNKIVGYEKWYTGCYSLINGDRPEEGRYWRANPNWLYSKDGKNWSPISIFHQYKYPCIGTICGFKLFLGDLIKYDGEVHEIVYDCPEYILKAPDGSLTRIHPGMKIEKVGNRWEDS